MPLQYSAFSLLQNWFNFKSFYDNSIYSNEGNSCRESFSCDGHFGILYFRVGKLTKSLLQIHPIVADANVIGRDAHFYTCSIIRTSWWRSHFYGPRLFQRYVDTCPSISGRNVLVLPSSIQDTYEFSNVDSTYQVERWYQSVSSKIIIDFTAFDKSSNYTLQVECRNIELLHNQDALVYFQRKS